MANQVESKIEDFAFDYLKNYYSQQYATGNILVGQNEKTKRGNTADGMLAFKKPTGEAFLANISMQQSSSLVGMLINYKKNGLGKLRLLTPLVLAMLCFALGKTTGNVLVMLIAPIVVAPLGFMLHTYLLKKYRYRQLETLLNTVKQAPADEQWIGLSISSLVLRNNTLAKTLLEMCQQKGLGLITVGKRSKIVLLQRPQNKVSRRSDYLSYYTSEATIRRALNEDHVLRVA
ncbi:hypothetical protein JAO76_01160 [Pontibacter sp. BT310]|uniref:Uncharacterized protein n=1 Tax=Pontibacter populi TaxID=890055 RepID=A0ABS6X6X4_9BACT|nr:MULTISPECIES: hypothetical protein [Pontibacter]MBJ6116779.1 hypothetical protein [Pontibacter sp. BT310]MBR0569201.1 hypothetical protein [Microvirga sp. STS03]MBW3363632.1 hypothetical protein [Pontibacter populi]